MITDPGRVPLGHRAWVGDGRHGASVAADGTIDWFCPTGITGQPALWRLLDDAGAAVRVGPVREAAAGRRHLPAATQSYLPGTNVLETTMIGPAARRVSVLDFMPWSGPGLETPGAIVRIVRALSGPVEVEVEVIPGGRRSREALPTAAGLLVGDLHIRADGEFRYEPLGRDEDRWRCVIALDSGQETVVTIGPRELWLPGAHRMLEDTTTAWRSWTAGAVLAGPYHSAAERALLATRMLTGPGGAPHAAGTSCLPRRVGSERCSDDRWVRLRDVTAATRILAAVGLAEDAEAGEGWLRETLSTAHLPWPGWFDADGQPVPDAEDWPFRGWRDSGPVLHGRVPLSSDAGLIGDVVAAIGASTSGPFGRRDDPGQLSAAWPVLAEATDRVADDWRDPDTGRWEIERPRRTYVAGRLAIWSALDRMTRLARARNPLDLQAVAWQQEAREVAAWLEGPALTAGGGLRMDGRSISDEPDAALLSAAWRGPWPSRHPVVLTTLERCLERQSMDLLIYRYTDRVADERSGPDHPDLEASLLAVKALCRTGRWEEAHERMEAVVALLGTGAGLATETADPVSRELFGNFPSTASALALVDASIELGAGPP